MKTVVSAADKLFELIDERYNVVADDGQRGVDFVGVPSGFPKLDHTLGGFRKGGLYILGGRTGMGKSALGLNLVQNISESGFVCYYSSLEMSAELLVLRLLSGLSLVDARQIEHGRMTVEDYQRVREAREKLNTFKFIIDDDRIPSKQLHDRLDKVAQKYGNIDFAVVDYLSLFTDLDPNEVQRLEVITANMSETASRFQIPLLGVVQLNRTTTTQEDSIPTLANIRYSDRIAQDAFSVFFVHRPAYYAKVKTSIEKEEDALIIVEKNRMGATGGIKANYYPRQMRWETREDIPTEPQALTLSEKIKQERIKV